MSLPDFRQPTRRAERLCYNGNVAGSWSSPLRRSTWVEQACRAIIAHLTARASARRFFVGNAGVWRVKWFWICFFGFLAVLVATAAIMRPDTVDATLAFTGAFLVAVAWTLFITLIVGLVVAGGIVGWLVVRKNQLNSLRQKDGHYPLQRVKLQNGQVIYFDPNVMVGAAVTIDRNTGTVLEHEPAAGWHVQATIRALVERTRGLQAMFQGDDSRADKYGSLHRGERVTAAATRLLDPPRRPLELPEPPPQPALPAPPPRIWTPQDALNTNTRTKLAMGTDTATGQIVKWDMEQAPHLRVHGKSQGSGKTNTIQTLAAGAVRTGAHLVVLDRRRFKDWGSFAHCAELVDTRDPRHFVQAVLRLCTLYQERDALLGQHGAPNIAALEQPPPRIVVAISEFGALCATAAAEGVLGDVLYPLSLILREAGATGVHVLIEDQVVDQRWPRGISANAEPVTGYLPVNYGAAGGYYDAHKLAPYQFHFAGTVFGTWPMAAVLPMVLADVRRSPAVVGSVRSAVRSDRSAPFAPEAAPSPALPPNATNGQPGEAGPTDLQALVWAWRDANPNGSQADMRRDFESAGVEIARGYAHELWHRYARERQAHVWM